MEKNQGKMLFGRKVDFLLLYMIIGFVFLSFRGMPWGTGSSTVLAFMLFFAGVFGTLWFKRKELSFGPKVVYIPLLLIVASSFMWIFLDDDLSIGIFYFVTLTFMFLLYLASMRKGYNLTWFAVPIIMILSASVMWDGVNRLLEHEAFIARATGFSENTDQVASILVVCIFLLGGRWKWLAFPAMITILFTGSYWALMALVGCGFIALVKKEVNLSKKFLTTLGCFVLLLVVVVASSTSIQERVWQVNQVQDAWEKGSLRGAQSLNTRLDANGEALRNFSFVGHGLDLEKDEDGGLHGQSNRYGINLHNVPLVLLDNMGVVAALSWLFVTLVAIYHSKRYRYALLAIFIMSATGSADWWWFNLWMPFYFALLGLVALEIKDKQLTPKWIRYRSNYVGKGFKKSSLQA